MALILCLLLMTTLCLVGGAALSVSGLNQKIVHNGRKQAQAFYAAEAGRELAAAYLKKDPLWRGEGDLPVSGFQGTLDIEGLPGVYRVTMSDGTDDGNGLYIPHFPAGHVRVESAGACLDALQAVSCVFHITPAMDSVAAFPLAAVVSAGPVAETLTALDDLGVENESLIIAHASLPEANLKALQAMAEAVFPSFDNDAWDASQGGIASFWLDPPANTRPRITYIQGDLALSGSRELYGIVFVGGKNVALEGVSEIHGVLFAPFATSVSLETDGVSGRMVVDGQIIAGPGGIEVGGKPVSVRMCPDYTDAFNGAAGSNVEIGMLSGSWKGS
jgi:hypothetical protein